MTSVATRAPNKDGRSGARARGAASARTLLRSGTPPGKRPKGRGKAATRNRGKARKAARKTQTGAPRPGFSANPVLILLEWALGVVIGIWMIAAHATGYAARAIGRGTLDLESAHRRDGLGLACFGAAIVSAAALWWGMGNAVGRVISSFVRGAFGLYIKDILPPLSVKT